MRQVKTALYVRRNAEAEDTAERIEHKVIDVKNAVGRRIDTIERTELRQLEKKREGKGKKCRLPKRAVEIIMQVDTKRKEKNDIADYLKPCRMRNVDFTDACQNPICLFLKIVKEGKRMELDTGRKWIFQYICKRRQRSNDVKIGTDQVQDKGVHNSNTKQNQLSVFMMLVNCIRDQKKDRDQWRNRIQHTKRQ